jgi:4-amino-4-deoxy-L-arabinose transferase-like glycosyltransferase
MSYSLRSGSAASHAESAGPLSTPGDNAWAARAWGRARALAGRAHPELLAVMALAGVLNLWDLSRNGFANQYYAAAVRSMSSNWHDFLYASMDRSGVMTVDKPPLALWVQALSVRVFGYHSLSILVPQALMGVASVALVYDLVRRRFGRVGGFVAALALALTPITVAISRHNNPDSLLVLCCVAALWCAARALGPQTRRRTRWLVATGVCVGLGFETKMLVALVVVPGIVLAWLWLAPGARGRLRALGQLLVGGVAMLVVGGAWPLLVELTPAAARPWISGTSDNRVLSLIFEYNGVGRVDGQAGGPRGLGVGAASNMFGGSTGPLRLLNSALGGQAGWLLGFALVSAVAVLVASRLRPTDARTGWLLAVGGAFVTTAVLFSFASGIFHPYYVSLLAPFAAALVGAGAAELLHGRVNTRIFGPLAIAAGVASELVVLGDYPGQLTWLKPVLIVAGLLAALALLVLDGRRLRVAALAGALALLLLAPGVWAFDTLGHATSGTFPEGGPSSALAGAGGIGGPRSFAGRGGSSALGGPGGPAGPNGAAGGVCAPAAGVAPGGAGVGAGGAAGPGGAGVPQLFGSGRASKVGGSPNVSTDGGGFGHAGGVGAAGAGALGAPIGGSVTSAVLSYVKQHGGGTIAVESQSNAASSIVEQDADVAGIGGFSGRESDVSISWLAQEVRSGRITWVLEEAEGSSSTRLGGPTGETRQGSRKAMAAVKQACVAVSLETSARASRSSAGASRSELYDCAGRAAELQRVGTQQSSS